MEGGDGGKGPEVGYRGRDGMATQVRVLSLHKPTIDEPSKGGPTLA